MDKEDYLIKLEKTIFSLLPIKLTYVDSIQAVHAIASEMERYKRERDELARVIKIAADFNEGLGEHSFIEIYVMLKEAANAYKRKK